MRRRDYIRAKECFSAYISIGEESEISTVKKKQAEKQIREISDHGLDDYNFLEAYDCVNRGDIEQGLSLIREFIESHPRVWNGWFVLGWGLRKLGRYEDGLEALKKAVELGGGSSDSRNEMAICFMELGILNGARKELEQALREEPENIKIISNLGVLAMKAGNKDEARAFFRTVLELDPDDTLANYFLTTK
jgi:tetratricopeptide (TPR) repeat protein